MEKPKSSSLARRSLRLAAACAVTTVVGLAGAVLIEGCSSSDSGTGGHRVVLATRVDVEPDAKTTFTTGIGWNVTLTSALIATGPFAYFDGAPPLVLQRARRNWEFAQRFLGLSSAHAHPGHYQAGNALGEMRVPWSVDLFAGPANLADGDGVTGTYRSGRFTFSVPPAGPAADALGGHAAIAQGVAEKEGQEKRIFRAIADLADIEKSATDGHIEGCEFVETDVETDGVVTAVVDPKVWFDLVDFSQIPEGSADAPSEFPAKSQPEIAFAQGVAQLSAYKFSFTKN